MGMFDNWPGGETVVNPNKSRRLSGKKRRQARKAARRTEAVLVVSDAVSVATPARLPVMGLAALGTMTKTELVSLAKRMNLKGWSALNKSDLIEFIHSSEENLR